MSPARRLTINILSGCSVTFGVATIVCAVTFYLSPKDGIAVVMAYSLPGCVVTSAIGIVFGVAALIVGAGSSRLACAGLLTCAIPVACLVVSFWDDLWSDGNQRKSSFPRPELKASPTAER
jgi:hypothetical protein